jgi:hypothetical protein
LFAAHLPNSIQRPWIQKVTRKAYREKTGGEYRGYAFLVFRSNEEATMAREVLDGTSVAADNTFKQMSSELQCLESFILKAQAVDNDDMAPAESAWPCFGKGGRSRPSDGSTSATLGSLRDFAEDRTNPRKFG